MVPVAAFFLSYIRVGADIMARNSDVASEIVAVIQAIIIMMIGAEALLAALKRRAILKNSAKEVES
jgi:simple sugar transport system permease protein